MFSLSVLGPGLFSTTVEMLRDGEWLALSLDFEEQQLDQILSDAPARTVNFPRAELTRDATWPREIELPDEVAF